MISSHWMFTNGTSMFGTVFVQKCKKGGLINGQMLYSQPLSYGT
jgi:hypothetical protein